MYLNNDFFNQGDKDRVINADFGKYKNSAKKIVAAVVVIILVLTVSVNTFYLLDSKEAAVVLHLGKVSHVESSAGIHFKIPFINQIRTVNIQNVYEMEYGYRTKVTGTTSSTPQYEEAEGEAQVIVDAANNNGSIAIISLNISYKVKDPVEYLFKVDDVEGTLRLALEDVVRNTLQAFTLDDARTKKDYIDKEVMPRLQKKLDRYEAGVEITSVKTQNVELLPAVEEAYRQKENANQYMNGKLEEAEKYNNTVLPQAEAEAERLIEDASGYKAEIIANAKASTAQFEALYKEYKNNPQIVKEKYYVEAMREFITNNNIVIDLTDEGEIHKFFNLDNNSFVKEQISTQ